MNDRLSVAIIGAGKIAGDFDNNRRENDDGIYSHAGAYGAQGGFRLATVFDSDPTCATAFAQTWKADRVATSLDDILRARHDVISICTPDTTHFPILKAILEAGCCRTVFAEKPLAPNPNHIAQIAKLSQTAGVHVVCNFQRRFEPVHAELRQRILNNPGTLLSASGRYTKGLHHIGVTMIDSLVYLCGIPEAVQSFHRVLNCEVDDFTYEFVLFYRDFTATITTVDRDRQPYHYHLFELDLLFADGRAALVDISQGLRESPVTGYAYSGVRILNERQAHYRETEYKRSMLAAAHYVHDITTGRTKHSVNTPQSSYIDALIVAGVEKSFHAGAKRLNLEIQPWKN